MVDVKRKKGESFEAMYRRFSKRMQQSGKVLEAKDKQFVKPKKNRTSKKKSALVSLKLRSKKEWLRKTGKLEEEPRRRW
ncbi:hypothetical protein COT95_00900 [Candidatus Falkowbacteria bacterium CG10_big_fil_rev_8_21_14_0_10_37_6]|uniref:30S ribosomal protein S21 n=1 Tax=Candidatus Falkowbacteria bacterium CG10_big_fil_rev_8_21_14_0_10_37_6 TaxID=1974563 RepID=A0A2H0V7G5_9BACT|nr:MAG: hypothetical protein COT95_00900 [Candidatus Falkowbacteria bacterium CG10_big_fil_rev_8_21_14_0_10_37_6]